MNMSHPANMNLILSREGKMDSERNYVFTERAHYMCPNMIFAIMASIDLKFDIKRIKSGITALRKAHPFLKSLIAGEDGSNRLYYALREDFEIPVTVMNDPNEWLKDYEELSLKGWNVHEEALLKVLVYPKDDQFMVLFVSHHLLCDGRGLLQLIQEFCEFYGSGKEPQFAKECLIRNLSDLPDNSDLSFISRVIINNTNKKWKKENKKVSYDEYLGFEKEFIEKNRINRIVVSVCDEELKKITDECRQNGISVNDWLIAKMMIEDSINKVVIAADIRDKVKCYNPGAMGNYATAFSVQIKKKYDSQISLAKSVSSEVKKICAQPKKEMLVLSCYTHMDPELLDAVAISSLSDFKSDAASFVGKNMFGYSARNGYCITNLGKIKSDVINEAFFIPPASPANKKAWGVLTVNDRMMICQATAD